MRAASVLLGMVCALAGTAPARGDELRAAAEPRVAEWPVTEGAPGGGRFSPLSEITPENVAQLRVAWTYRHGDFWEGSFPLPVNRGSAFESTPIVGGSRPSSCPPGSTRGPSATGSAPTAGSSWWSHPAGTSASARRSAIT